MRDSSQALGADEHRSYVAVFRSTRNVFPYPHLVVLNVVSDDVRASLHVSADLQSELVLNEALTVLSELAVMTQY